jgi:hypothetical protein
VHESRFGAPSDSQEEQEAEEEPPAVDSGNIMDTHHIDPQSVVEGYRPTAKQEAGNAVKGDLFSIKTSSVIKTLLPISSPACVLLAGIKGKGSGCKFLSRDKLHTAAHTLSLESVPYNKRSGQYASRRFHFECSCLHS